MFVFGSRFLGALLILRFVIDDYDEKRLLIPTLFFGVANWRNDSCNHSTKSIFFDSASGFMIAIGER